MAQHRLGIIGAGSIGSTVAGAFRRQDSPYLITSIADIDRAKALHLAEACSPAAAVEDIAQLVSGVDVVLECAAASLVPELIQIARASAVNCGLPRHLVVMSVGGLLGIDTAGSDVPVLHVPSGALGALDAVQAMKESGLEEVVLTTTKPPSGLGIETDRPLVLFEGPAAEVVVRYPKNTNVAMALSLAGIGPERTMVRLVADPATSANTHHVVARGAAGVVEFTSRNLPFPDNPRTSYLAAMSAISILRRITSPLQLG